MFNGLKRQYFTRTSVSRSRKLSSPKCGKTRRSSYPGNEGEGVFLEKVIIVNWGRPKKYST